MHPNPTPAGFSADDPEAIARSLLLRPRRVLLFGKTGSGKSTLATRLAQWLDASGFRHRILGGDPGSPAFGIPGAVCLGRWREGNFQLMAVEALCTLNAGRFRLPLTDAVRRLIAPLDAPLILIDGPGLTRGVAAAELLTGLVDAAGADTILLMIREGEAPPLTEELHAAGIEIYPVMPSTHARSPKSRQRLLARTALWDAYISDLPVRRMAWNRHPLLGTPPPAKDPQQWTGRQIALLEKGHTIAMGEIVAVDPDHLLVRLPDVGNRSSSLLVRDAGRSPSGGLGTVPPLISRMVASPDDHDLPRWAIAPSPPLNLGTLMVTLQNGIFGDPLLHLRLPNQKRSLLFDLGEGSRLPARIAHQVSDVFITHAHVDHISGFFWLLRSRIGELPACRLYGPPGLSRHIAGMVDGIRWDRIGRRGPKFEIIELHETRLAIFHLQVGKAGIVSRGERMATDGCLVDDSAFTIRAAIVDHGIPVMALAYEEAPHYHVQVTALDELGCPPGPWLAGLKRRVADGDCRGRIKLPDGRSRTVERMARELIRMTPGKKLVYATDMADTPDNRKKLTALARGATVLFCEASFAEKHRNLAAATGHLTARACGEIAAEAGVKRLVPIHLSRRYEHCPERVYAEIRTFCPGVAIGGT